MMSGMNQTDQTLQKFAAHQEPTATVSPQTPIDETIQPGQNEPSIKPLNFDSQKGNQMRKTNSKAPYIVLLLAIVLGISTGYGINKLSAKNNGSGTSGPQEIKQVAGENIQAGDIFGSPDESTFKDSAQGYLEAGGLDGEGSHKLLRPGGDAQTVYLTSSITDLDKFVGMEVKIWGETFKGQKAGWLMDVGRVEVVSTTGEAPEE